MSGELDWSLAKQIRSEVVEARSVLDELLGKLSEAGWTEDQTFGVHLSVEEALMNAIKHGNGLNPAKSVGVEFRLRGSDLWISIEDEGVGFDPNSVPDPTLDENLELPSGRGLMLMRTFMTVVKYNERGNRVEMSKSQLDAPGGDG